MSRRISESGEDLCPVCSEIITIYAVGSCDHPVCYRCSTRMRVLCEQLYCAICRTDLPKVVFLKQLTKFESVDTMHFQLFRKNKIYFDTELSQAEFFKLLEHRCPMCPSMKGFRTFGNLRDHMRKDHTHFYCDLCVKHLKVFTQERKYYSRSALATHRRVGDPDDKSHKGHPLCEFCEERFLDNDELVRHLRKEHFFCHFCDADGIANQFYSEYPLLRSHFRDEHFLCQEGDCYNVEFTNAFRTEIDLKAHKSVAHTKSMKKSQVRQARTLDIDFNLTPRFHEHGRGRGRDRGRDRGVITGDDYEEVNVHNRGGDRDRGGGGTRDRGGGGGRNRRGRNYDNADRVEEDTARAISMSLAEAQKQEESTYQQRSEDFPTLDGKTVSSDEEGAQSQKSNRSLAIRVAKAAKFSVNEGPMEDEDFPTLGGSRPSLPPPPPIPTPTTNPEPKRKPPSKAKPSSNNSQGQTAWSFQGSEGDFPALGGGKMKPKTGPLTANWKPKPASAPAKPIQPQQKVWSMDDYPSLSSISSGLMASTTPKPVPVPGKVPTASSPIKSVKTNTKPEKHSSKVLEFKGPKSAKDKKKTVPQQQQQQTKKPSVYDDLVEGDDHFNNDVKPNLGHAPKTSSNVSVITSKDLENFDKPTSISIVRPTGEDFPSLGKSKKSGHTNKDWAVQSAKSSGKAPLQCKPVPTNNNKFANLSVDEEDYPSFEKTNTSTKSGKGFNVDDFPSLGKSGKSTAPTNTTWGPKLKEEPPKPKEESPFVVAKIKKKKSKGTYGSNDTSASSDGMNSDVNEIAELLNSKPTNKKETVMENLSNRKTKPEAKVADLKEDVLTKDVEIVGKTQELIIDDIPKLPSQVADVLQPMTLDDFPSLHTGESNNLPRAGPPPGFIAPKAPPPGFRTPSVAAPPGFTQLAASVDPSGTFAVNNSENIAPLPGACYVHPASFHDRNMTLLRGITDTIDGEKFAQFKSASGLFRQDKLSAKDYYNKCLETLGKETFQDLFPELLALLPDIPKQQELLLAHNASTAGNSKGGKKGAWKRTDTTFITCTVCGQVLLPNDATIHMEEHNVDSDFPSLGTAPSNSYGMSSWVKA